MPGPLPDSLRQAIGNDLQPVRPLPPAWVRTLFAVAVTAVCLGIVAVIFKLSLRSDMDQIPMWLSWGCTVIQLAIGVVLVGMALREAVPGNGVPATIVIDWLASKKLICKGGESPGKSSTVPCGTKVSLLPAPYTSK